MVEKVSSLFLPGRSSWDWMVTIAGAFPVGGKATRVAIRPLMRSSARRVDLPGLVLAKAAPLSRLAPLKRFTPLEKISVLPAPKFHARLLVVSL